MNRPLSPAERDKFHAAFTLCLSFLDDLDDAAPYVFVGGPLEDAACRVHDGIADLHSAIEAARFLCEPAPAPADAAQVGA